MREVLENINKLQALLEEKIKTTEVLNSQLSNKNKEAEVIKEKAIAKLNHASAMERVYKKYEDFDKEVKRFNEERKVNEARIALAQEQEENDAKVLKQIAEENKQLDARKLALNKQAVAIKEKEINFDKKKDDLRAMISGQAIKDILK